MYFYFDPARFLEVWSVSKPQVGSAINPGEDFVLHLDLRNAGETHSNVNKRTAFDIAYGQIR